MRSPETGWELKALSSKEKGLPHAGGPIGKGCCAKHIGPKPSEWDVPL